MLQVRSKAATAAVAVFTGIWCVQGPATACAFPLALGTLQLCWKRYVYAITVIGFLSGSRFLAFAITANVYHNKVNNNTITDPRGFTVPVPYPQGGEAVLSTSGLSTGSRAERRFSTAAAQLPPCCGRPVPPAAACCLLCWRPAAAGPLKQLPTSPLPGYRKDVFALAYTSFACCLLALLGSMMMGTKAEKARWGPRPGTLQGSSAACFACGVLAQLGAMMMVGQRGKPRATVAAAAQQQHWCRVDGGRCTRSACTRSQPLSGVLLPGMPWLACF